ncbi:MAG: glycine-rich domain-containing protein [Candidatus Micrarchaeales archaeon]
MSRTSAFFSQTLQGGSGGGGGGFYGTSASGGSGGGGAGQYHTNSFPYVLPVNNAATIHTGGGGVNVGGSGGSGVVIIEYNALGNGTP